MAKLKGFELKNITNFRGHEGEPLMQGNVYYKNKKVGFWSQDSWGGPDNFTLDYGLDKELRDKINKILFEYVGGKIFRKLDELTYGKDFKLEQKGYEFFFCDLIQLKNHEDTYKKYSKKWKRNRIYIIYNDAFHTTIASMPTDEDIEKKFPNKLYYKYESLNDFVKE
jgi:hypothetical protein